MCFVSGVKIVYKQVDVDYTEYLGPNYMKNHSAIKQPSTLVANHISFFDNWVVPTF